MTDVEGEDKPFPQSEAVRLHVERTSLLVGGKCRTSIGQLVGDRKKEIGWEIVGDGAGELMIQPRRCMKYEEGKEHGGDRDVQR